MTKAQERAAARRRYERQQAALAQRRLDAARNKKVVVVVVAVLAVVALFVGLSGVIGKKPANQATPAAGTSPTTTVAGCAQPPSPLGTNAEGLKLPNKATAAGKTFTAVIGTNCGNLTVQLDGTKAPQAVASFLYLADQNYWVRSPCHRLTTEGIFVLQCGDPTGTGTGDPGYGFGVENAPKDSRYPRGTLAMARTADKVTGNGGQFFILYKDSTIQGGYTIFGKVTGGMDIVDKIAKAGVAGGGTDGTPAAPISMLTVSVTEKKG